MNVAQGKDIAWHFQSRFQQGRHYESISLDIPKSKVLFSKYTHAMTNIRQFEIWSSHCHVHSVSSTLNPPLSGPQYISSSVRPPNVRSTVYHSLLILPVSGQQSTILKMVTSESIAPAKSIYMWQMSAGHF